MFSFHSFRVPQCLSRSKSEPLPSCCKLGWRRSCAPLTSHQFITGSHRDKQPFALTFTPAVDSKLMCMSAGGNHSTRREPTRRTCTVPSLFSLHRFIRSCFCSVFSGCVSISHISIGSWQLLFKFFFTGSWKMHNRGQWIYWHIERVNSVLAHLMSCALFSFLPRFLWVDRCQDE